MTVPHRTVSVLPVGTAFARYVMLKAIQEKYGTKPALDEAAALTNTPTVYATLEAELQTKAAVAAGTTSDALRRPTCDVRHRAGSAATDSRRVNHRGSQHVVLRAKGFRPLLSLKGGAHGRMESSR
jgi:hypothetical protein